MARQTVKSQPLPVVAKGYYRLTKAIANPMPDRRRNNTDCAVTWGTGTVVQVVPGNENTCGTVKFRDHSYVMWGGTSHERKEQRVGNEIVQNIEPVPDNLWIVIRESNGLDYEDVLAHLLDTAKITLDDVKASVAAVEAMEVPIEDSDYDHKEHNALLRRHGLPTFE